MNKLIVLLLALCSFYYVYEITRPVEHFSVSVVVQRGDCLQDIICDLQEKYGDKRDWREIAYEVRKLHGITKWIFPGQELIVPLEVRK